MSETHPTSFRLSSTAIAILEKAETNLGLKRSATVEMALRTWAKNHMGKTRSKDPKNPKKTT